MQSYKDSNLNYLKKKEKGKKQNKILGKLDKNDPEKKDKQ